MVISIGEGFMQAIGSGPHTTVARAHRSDAKQDALDTAIRSIRNLNDNEDRRRLLLELVTERTGGRREACCVEWKGKLTPHQVNTSVKGMVYVIEKTGVCEFLEDRQANFESKFDLASRLLLFLNKQLTDAQLSQFFQTECGQSLINSLLGALCSSMSVRTADGDKLAGISISTSVNSKRFLNDLTPILQRLHVPVNSARWSEFLLGRLQPHTNLSAVLDVIGSDPAFSGRPEDKSEVRPENGLLRQLAVMMLLVQKKLVGVKSPTTDPAAAAPASVPTAVAAARVPVARVSPPPAASPPPAVQAVPVHAPRPGEIKRPGYTSIDPAEVQSGKVSDHSPIYGRIGFGHTELGYFSMNVRCWNTYPKAGGGMQVDSLLNASHKDFFKNSQARVMAAMAQLGQEGQPEIACFQEVNGPMGQILATELKARGYQVFYNGVRKEVDPDDWDGRLTAFKLPAGSQAGRFAEYENAYQTKGKPNKGFQVFVVFISGEDPLLLINGHKAPANLPAEVESRQRTTAMESHADFVTQTKALMGRFPISMLLGDLNEDADAIERTYAEVGTVCRSDRLTYIGQVEDGPSRPDHAVVGRGVTSVYAG
jgi:hypothetical protein